MLPAASDFYGLTYEYKNGEKITVYRDDAGNIENIGYKGKQYSYESVKSGEQSFADADFIASIESAMASVVFGEDYSYEYYEDINDYRDKDGYTSESDPSKRYTLKNGTIAADADAVKTDDGNSITFIYKFTVPETALYSLAVDYFLPANRANSALLGLQINGKAPFKDALNMELKRTYDFYDLKSLDVGGNEIRSKQQERFLWKETVLSSPEGLYKNPLQVCAQRRREHRFNNSFKRAERYKKHKACSACRQRYLRRV